MEGNPVTLMATATDPDGDAMTYSWTQDSGATAALSNPSELTTMFTAPSVGSDNNATLQFTISANDGHGGIGSDTVLVHVISASAYKISTLSCAPIIRSHEGGSATLVEAVDNPSNAPLSYEWTQISGVPVQISSTTDSSPTVNLPTGSGGSVFAFQLTLSQSGTVVGNCEQYVYAAYPEPGAPPHADAGPYQVVNGGDQVTLDGTKSTGGYLTYSWTQIAGEPVQLLSANTAKPIFTAPDVALGQSKELVFTNIVKNAFGKDGAIVHITVVHPSLPPNAVITLK
jgi:large repetitive protein